MTPEDYNDHQAGRLWAIHDLPASLFETAHRDGVRSNRFTAAVRRVQAEQGVTPDGRLGPRTWAMLQRENRHPADGRSVLITIGAVSFQSPTRPEAPPETPIEAGRAPSPMASLWNRYGGALEHLADQYRIPVGAALAVFLTEAGRRAYDPETGLVIIRFEQHLFQRRLKRPREKMIHDGRQPTEWAALTAAADLDFHQAFSCTSFGLPQIMGFNFRSVGYNSPLSMALAFQDNVTAQIQAFFAFCQTNGLDDYIREKDWRSFTRRYNGPGQVDHYAGVLAHHLGLAQNLGFAV